MAGRSGIGRGGNRRQEEGQGSRGRGGAYEEEGGRAVGVQTVKGACGHENGLRRLPGGCFLVTCLYVTGPRDDDQLSAPEVKFVRKKVPRLCLDAHSRGVFASPPSLHGCMRFILAYRHVSLRIVTYWLVTIIATCR
jgi:hypothetical protein